MQVAALEGHRIWSRVYDSQTNPLLGLESRILGDSLGPLEGKHCVDIACGTGRWMAYSQSRGAHVTGIDACREMLLEAGRKPHLAGRLVRAHAGLLPVADRVADLTLCSFALGYMPDAPAAIREMARIAAPGSRVIVTDLHPQALEAGWTRSFRYDGIVYEIEHFSHSVPGLLDAAQDAGLRLEGVIDEHIGEPERATFSRAGKDHLFPELTRIPAIWIATWTKS